MADFGVTEVLAIAAVAGAATSAYGAYASGQAQDQSAKYNARLAEQQAQQARDAAAIDAENQARLATREQATNRARAAASGVESAYGSPLLVQMENARLAELEHQRVLYTGELRGSGLQANANLSRFQGSAAARAGQLGAGINLLSGVSTAAGAYARPTTSGKRLLTDSV